MNILVTGGAGYIGSHTAHLLEQTSHKIVVLDNLYSGHQWAVPKTATFYEGSFGDKNLLDQIMKEHEINAVLHFAAFIEVEESTKDPIKYYKNNTVNALTLLEACLEHGVERFIFSSTAATYGNPEVLPVKETNETKPINPYGNTKLCTEKIIQDVAEAEKLKGNNFKYVILRYFNVAGASASGKIGQATPRATHLIKVASEVATGKRKGMKIFGTDYPTSDGTCVRDYIHVDDLAKAHLDALSYLEKGESNIFNCGYGHGYSVKEVIQTIQKISGKKFDVETTDRREGDPAELVAENNKIKKVLGWSPDHDNLEYICQTAYNWEKQLSEKL